MRLEVLLRLGHARAHGVAVGLEQREALALVDGTTSSALEVKGRRHEPLLSSGPPACNERPGLSTPMLPAPISWLSPPMSSRSIDSLIANARRAALACALLCALIGLVT